jgi:Putative transposase
LIPNELLVRVARTDYADAGLRSCSEHEFGRQTNWENLEPLEFMQRLAALVPRPRLHLIRFQVPPLCNYDQAVGATISG